MTIPLNYKITAFDYGKMGVIEPAVACGAYPPSLVPYSIAGAALLQGDGKNILLDTGIDTSDAEKAEYCKAFMLNCHHAAEMLELVDLKPEDIDIVILSHAHADHAGALEVFPNAHFYIQKEEVEGWEDLFADPRMFAMTIGAQLKSDIDRIRQLESAGRLTLLDGDVENLLPGISVCKTSLCHSFADQFVIVENADETFVYTGDLANHPTWLETSQEEPFFKVNKIFGIGSVYNQAKGYQRILEFVDNDINKLICPHDNTRSERFKELKRAADDLAAYAINY